MSTPPPEETPKPDPPPPPPAAVPPPPTRWKRYKLPVNRKDRVARAAPLPAAPSADPPPKSNAIRVLLIMVGVLVLVPIVGCGFLWLICSRGLR